MNSKGEVNPSTTWIDVNEQLPEQLSDSVLVRYHAHFDDEEITEFDVCVAHFGINKFSVRDQYFYTRRKVKVTHWMPLTALGM